MRKASLRSKYIGPDGARVATRVIAFGLLWRAPEPVREASIGARGALAEAGDLLGPLERGVIRREHIEGELADFVSGRVAGRRGNSDIILFKSVGTAIEHLATARLIVATASGGET